MEPDQDAQPVERTPPAYPHPALLLCIEGDVLLELTIDTRGRVSDADVLKSQPPGIFDGAARRAVDNWHYRPKCVDGQANSSMLKTRIEFRLHGESIDDCSDEPVQLEATTLTLLGEIGALYTLTAEAQLGSLSIDQLEEIIANATEPALDSEAQQVWRYHRNTLLDAVDLAQTRWRRLRDLGFPGLLLSNQTYVDDPDMRETKSALPEMREALDEYAEGLTMHQRDMHARHGALASRTSFDHKTLELLTHDFSGHFDQEAVDREILELEQQYNLISEIVALLHRQRGHWRIDHSGNDFDDPEVEEAFEQLLTRLHELVHQRRENHFAALREFEDYSLSD